MSFRPPIVRGQRAEQWRNLKLLISMNYILNQIYREILNPPAN